MGRNYLCYHNKLCWFAESALLAESYKYENGIVDVTASREGGVNVARTRHGGGREENW
jgi:hypothetical protein